MNILYAELQIVNTKVVTNSQYIYTQYCYTWKVGRVNFQEFIKWLKNILSYLDVDERTKNPLNMAIKSSGVQLQLRGPGEICWSSLVDGLCSTSAA